MPRVDDLERSVNRLEREPEVLEELYELMREFDPTLQRR